MQNTDDEISGSRPLGLVTNATAADPANRGVVRGGTLFADVALACCYTRCKNGLAPSFPRGGLYHSLPAPSLPVFPPACFPLLPLECTFKLCLTYKRKQFCPRAECTPFSSEIPTSIRAASPREEFQPTSNRILQPVHFGCHSRSRAPGCFSLHSTHPSVHFSVGPLRKRNQTKPTIVENYKSFISRRQFIHYFSQLLAANAAFMNFITCVPCLSFNNLRLMGEEQPVTDEQEKMYNIWPNQSGAMVTDDVSSLNVANASLQQSLARANVESRLVGGFKDVLDTLESSTESDRILFCILPENLWSNHTNKALYRLLISACHSKGIRMIKVDDDQLVRKIIESTAHDRPELADLSYECLLIMDSNSRQAMCDRHLLRFHQLHAHDQRDFDKLPTINLIES